MTSTRRTTRGFLYRMGFQYRTSLTMFGRRFSFVFNAPFAPNPAGRTARRAGSGLVLDRSSGTRTPGCVWWRLRTGDSYGAVGRPCGLSQGRNASRCRLSNGNVTRDPPEDSRATCYDGRRRQRRRTSRWAGRSARTVRGIRATHEGRAQAAGEREDEKNRAH